MLSSEIGDGVGFAQLQVLSPNLSGFVPVPGVAIKFDVTPLPIAVKSSGLVTIVPGTPAKTTLSILAKGGSTHLKLVHPTNLPAGITISYPPSAINGEILVGDGSSSMPILLNAPFDPNSK
jgi:hypothetical protein